MWSHLEALFSSAARVRILRLFLLSPTRPFYQREIAREAGQPIRAVQREVDRLVAIGLLRRTAEANRIFYCLEPEFPLLGELQALFEKAAGAAAVPARHAPGQVLPPERWPDPAGVRQPFGWMETPGAKPLPDTLRRVQAEQEWDTGY